MLFTSSFAYFLLLAVRCSCTTAARSKQKSTKQVNMLYCCCKSLTFSCCWLFLFSLKGLSVRICKNIKQWRRLTLILFEPGDLWRRCAKYEKKRNKYEHFLKKKIRIRTFDFKLVTPSRGNTSKPLVVTYSFLKKKKLIIFFNGNLQLNRRNWLLRNFNVSNYLKNC